MDRTERFHLIDQMLCNQRSVSRQQFLDALEVSPATFKRDLEYLRDRLAAPIVWDRELRGYRYEQDPDGDWILVGAQGHAIGGEFNTGAAYAFGRDQGGAGAWGEVATQDSEADFVRNLPVQATARKSSCTEGHIPPTPPGYFVPISPNIIRYGLRRSTPNKGSRDDAAWSSEPPMPARNAG